MKKAAIFGVGSYFKQYFNLINKIYEICILTDNNCTSWGQKLHGIECIEPDRLFDYKFDVLIIAVFLKKFRADIVKQIQKQCQQHGIEIIMAEQCAPKNFSAHDILDGLNYSDAYENKIMIEEDVSINNLNIIFNGCHNSVSIAKGVKVRTGLTVYFGGDDNELIIGEDTSIVSIHCEIAEKGLVCIGKDCMISWDVEIFQNPTHPVFDLQTGKRTNQGRTVVIGDHVWIGKGVGLMSGFSIGNGSVIGYGSVSSGHFGEDLIIVGNPAKVIREGVYWKRDLTGFYPLDEMELEEE